VKFKKIYTLREAEPADVAGIIACVKDEYGDTYYRREFYDEETLKTNLDKYNIFIVSTDDDICGIQSMIDSRPIDTYLEGASQIFKKKYRGLGLPSALVSYTYEIAKEEDISCIYASTVTFHNITQRMCEKNGMIPVAFNFGSYITANMDNSFELGHSEKYAQAILVKPIKKQNAGKIYIDEQIKRIVSSLYKKLNVGFEIDTTENKPEEKKTQFTIKLNEREQMICVRVNNIGLDLKEVISDVINSHKGELWTTQVILPTSDVQSVWAQKQVREIGFFFSGLRPLCNEKEQLYMQYIGDVKFYFDELVLTDSFRELLDELLKVR